MMGALKDVLLWLYWLPFRSLVQALPLGWSRRLARTLGTVYFFIASGKRRRYEREYQEVFGGIIENGDARSAARRAFKVWMQDEIEVLLFSTMNPGNIDAFVSYRGIEHLDRALEAGKGAMLIFAHFGSNQMIMPAVGHKGYEMGQLSAPPTVWVEKLAGRKFSRMGRKALDLRWEQEQSLPVRHINIFGSLKGAFVTLKKNGVLGVAIDGGGGVSRVEMDFLGRKAFFSTGSIEIAMRAGCPVLPTFMVRGSDGRHAMTIEPPLAISAERTEEAVRNNMGLFLARFEPYVLKYPCHYLTFLSLRRFMEEQGDTPFFVPVKKEME